jgi:unsaturated chondroitin disaccharide hydrolase
MTHRTIEAALDLFARRILSSSAQLGLGWPDTADPDSEELVRRYTHKGLHANATWVRAQAWAILAFAAGARCFPEEPGILQAAWRAAAWWMARAPGDEIVAWDFETPADDLRDSSASAIAVAGLLKLAPYVSSREAGQLREVARRTVETLVSHYLTPVVPADARGRAC